MFKLKVIQWDAWRLTCLTFTVCGKVLTHTWISLNLKLQIFPVQMKFNIFVACNSKLFVSPSRLVLNSNLFLSQHQACQVKIIDSQDHWVVKFLHLTFLMKYKICQLSFGHDVFYFLANVQRNSMPGKWKWTRKVIWIELWNGARFTD